MGKPRGPTSSASPTSRPASNPPLSPVSTLLELRRGCSYTWTFTASLGGAAYDLSAAVCYFAVKAAAFSCKVWPTVTVPEGGVTSIRLTRGGSGATGGAVSLPPHAASNRPAVPRPMKRRRDIIK